MNVVDHTKKWQIGLKAEADLLEMLSYEFCNSDLRIFQDSGCWFLDSTYFDTNEALQVYEKGEELISALNSTLWLNSYKLDPIKSCGYYLLNIPGERIRKFDAIGKVTAPTRLIVSSNDIPDRRFFDLLNSDLKTGKALALFNNPAIDWFTLYKIFEIVRDDHPDIPGSKDYKTLINEWTPEGDWQCFLDTANWNRHSEHGTLNGQPRTKPNPTMSLSEAQIFVRKLLIAWLNHKIVREK